MSSFSDPQVVRRLREQFVPVAIDCVPLRGGDDPASRWFRRIADEAALNPPPKQGGSPSRQGHYVALAYGPLLAAHNRRGAAAVLALMDEALARARRLPQPPAAEPPPAGPQRRPTLAPGGLRLDVYTRILRWQPGALADLPAEFARWNRERTGLDHLWIWPDELAALLPPPHAQPGHRWSAPRRLARRIARFHLVDDVRGEPDAYRANEVREARIE
ncbi:MAG: hypothetical protein D6776_06680, partial [Planctomycetota bacterium]